MTYALRCAPKRVCGLLCLTILIALAATTAATASVTVTSNANGATFTGSSDLGGTIPNEFAAIFCPPPSLEAPGAHVCENVIVTATATGTATVSISFDVFDQFTLLVRDSTGTMTIAQTDCADQTTSGLTATCTLTFSATAGTTYDIVIVPTFALPGDTFAGSVTFASGTGGGGSGGGGGTSSFGHMTGGGKVPGSTEPSVQFSLNVFQTDSATSKGNVHYGSNTSCMFVSDTYIAQVTGSSSGGTATVDGTGRVRMKGGSVTPNVHFRARGVDGGGSSGDSFTITVDGFQACSGGGGLLNGQVTFHA